MTDFQPGNSEGAHGTDSLAPSAAEPRPIYLDHQATTPVDPRVAEVMVRAMTEHFGNPNSTHHVFGQAAARVMRDAARSVAALVEAAPGDVRFTTGASEAIRLAFAYALERRESSPLIVAASRVEHPAVLEELTAGERDGRYRVVWMPVDGAGRVSLETVVAALKTRIDLLCLMAANNEVGTIQPFAEAAELAHRAGAEVLIDATQAAGRLPISVAHGAIDYLVMSGHKIYGPKGVGALIGAELGEAPAPERLAVHNATPNVPGIAGLGEACRLRRLEMEADEVRIARLRDHMQAALQIAIPGLQVNGAVEHRLAGSLHISIPGVQNDILVANLRDIVALSTGAACMSGVDASTHVFEGMQLEDWRLDGAVRIGLGRDTTEADVDHAVAYIAWTVQDLQTAVESPA